MYLHMYKYMDRNRHTQMRRLVGVLYMHNDYMPIRGIQGRIHTYNIDTGRKRSGITGDSTITGIDEQLTGGIGSACVIDLANLPLRPARC